MSLDKILGTAVRARINELGKIKIGGKDPNERSSNGGGTWRAPQKYDHFVITTLNRDARGDLLVDQPLMDSLAKYADSTDGKLRQLPVALLSNEISDILQCSYVWYIGKRIAGRSDGDRLELFHNRKTNEWYDHPREEEWNDKYAAATDSKGNKLFKLHTTLNVVIASPEARWGGFYKFRTTSKISADQLYGSLVAIQQLTYGVLRGMPLRLVVRPLQVNPSGKATTVYVVHLELVGSDLQAIQQQAISNTRFEIENRKTIQRAAIEYKRIVTSPGYDESDIEQADVGEEFHPEGLAEGEVPNEPAPIDPLASKLGLTPVPEPLPVTDVAHPPTPEPNSDDPPDEDDFDDEPPLPEDGHLFGGNGASEKKQLDATK